ncbi:hypothetical protein [Bradyrhizobium cosmicum]|uniref:hypothetical protein n=1 Tax=Bradyrhizobium cosmicum TaxID=1404864 RepID=UPI0028E5A90B|nr:hypothetical protein [Bradyrhizobium cosmicum]
MSGDKLRICMSFSMGNRSGIEGSLAKERKLPEGSNAILLEVKPMNAANYASLWHVKTVAVASTAIRG